MPLLLSSLRHSRAQETLVTQRQPEGVAAGIVPLKCLDMAVFDQEGVRGGAKTQTEEHLRFILTQVVAAVDITALFSWLF